MLPTKAWAHHVKAEAWQGRAVQPAQVWHHTANMHTPSRPAGCYHIAVAGPLVLAAEQLAPVDTSCVMQPKGPQQNQQT